jgi:hypothetical protein
MEACNNLSQLPHKSNSFKDNNTRNNFYKDLNSLVVDMAIGNRDLVDFFFITRYLTKLAQANDLNRIINNENLAKILSFYAEKLNEEGSKSVLSKYRMNNDLLDIGVKFGNKVHGYTDMFLDKIKNDSQMKLRSADDALFVLNVRSLIW